MAENLTIGKICNASGVVVVCVRVGGLVAPNYY